MKKILIFFLYVGYKLNLTAQAPNYYYLGGGKLQDEGGPSVGGQLPPGTIVDKLKPEYQYVYETVPLRWGFEQGQLAPYWNLLYSGYPNYAVRTNCFLGAHSGVYQLCSAYPWSQRNLTHGLLQVRNNIIFNV